MFIVTTLLSVYLFSYGTISSDPDTVVVNESGPPGLSFGSNRLLIEADKPLEPHTFYYFWLS